MRMIERERSELSRSRTAIGRRVARPALNTLISTAIRADRDDGNKGEQERPAAKPADLSPEHQPEARSQRSAGQHSAAPFRPGDDRAHPRAQAFDRLQRHRADLKGPQIEIAGRPRRAPGCILSLNIDHGHAHRYDLRLERGNGDVERIADLQSAKQILPQVESEPDILGVDQREQRCAGAEILAQRSDARRDLRGDRSTDRQLGNIDLALVQRRFGLLDLSRRERLSSALEPVVANCSAA